MITSVRKYNVSQFDRCEGGEGSLFFYLSENLVNKRNIVDVSLTVHRSVYQSINFRVIRERAKRENTDGVTFTP